MTKIQGVISALITPFTPDGGGIDEIALDRLVDRLIEDGINGFVACSSSGEVASLSQAERRQVAERVVSRSNGRVPVVVNTGAMTTAECIELSGHAESIGADAVMALPPFFEPIGLPEVRGYYESVAEAVDIPIIVYNNPAAAAVTMSADFIGELGRDVENISYVKESSGDPIQLLRLLTRHSEEISVLNGIDLFMLSALQMGATGSITGGPNCAPRECVALAAAYGRGDQNAVDEIWRDLVPAFLSLLDAPSYGGCVKAACESRGLKVGEARPPAKLDADARAYVAAAFGYRDSIS